MTKRLGFLAKWSAPFLLTAVALHQMYLTQASVLSPWCGGGFGMFSVADSHAARTWSVECLDAESRPCHVYVPAQVGGQFSLKFRALPEVADLERILDSVEKQDLVRSSRSEIAAVEGLRAGYMQLSGIDTPVLRQAATYEQGLIVKPVALKAAAWRLRFDLENLTVTAERIGEAVSRGEW